MSSSCLLIFFSFLPIIFYLLHASLGEVLRLQRMCNFPDLLCCLFHLPKSKMHFSLLYIKFKFSIYTNNSLPVHVFLSSFLLVQNNHHTFLKVIYQLLHSKQILHLALLRDILQSINIK